MLLQVDPNHHPVWEAIRGGLGGTLTGGAAFRYSRIAVKTMPAPLDKDGRFYHWAYDFLQNIFDNQELRSK